MPVSPAAEECLLVPFYVDGKAVGTIWGIMHTDRRKFDAEDDRVMASLGKFASSAYQALVHIEDLKFQVAEREKAEAEVRELARGLEAKMRRLVEANVVGIAMWNLEGSITEANDAFLQMVQYDREDLTSGRVRWTDLTPAEWCGSDERAIADLKVRRSFTEHFSAHEDDRICVIIICTREIAYSKQPFGKKRSGFVVESLHEKPSFSSLRFGLDGRVQRAPAKADEEQVSACRYVDITNPNHDGN
jgi:PAS domain-containing protein